jgi:site-specific DNA recombinase
VLHVRYATSGNEDKMLLIPWIPRGPGTRNRAVLQPALGEMGYERPMRSEIRSALLRAIALGRLWLQELTSGKIKDIDEIVVREGSNARSVHMTISLAFLAPDIIEAAIEGALPPRIGIARLTNLSSGWRKQREILGLRQPFERVVNRS